MQYSKDKEGRERKKYKFDVKDEAIEMWVWKRVCLFVENGNKVRKA